MIMITHDLGVVAQICSSVAIIYAGEIVEYGRSRISTRGTSTIPIRWDCSVPYRISPSTAKRLTPIDGLMPDPTKPLPGCRFADRCPHAMEICHTKSRRLVDFSGHQIKCFLYSQRERPRRRDSKWVRL